jgi:WD40 repeat protein/GTPase SAR1 family protein
MASPGWTLKATLPVHDDVINRVAWAADGSAFATCGDDGRLVISNAQTGKPSRVIRLEGPVLDASFSPDAQRIACTSVDPSASEPSSGYGLEPEAEPLPANLDDVLGDYSVSAEWEPDPGQGDGLGLPIRMFDTGTGELLASFLSDHSDEIPTAIEWTPDGKRIVTASFRDGLTVWQTRTSAVLTHDSDIRGEAVAISPDGQYACVAGADGWQVVDLRTGAEHDGNDDEDLTSVAWSSQDHIALGTAQGVVFVYRLKDRTVRVLEAHTALVTAVSFSHDAGLLATKSLDGRVLLWDTRDWALLSTLDEPARGQSVAAGVAFAPDADRLLTLGPAGKRARLWSLDRVVLAARQEIAPTAHYSNAKVILLGDQSVGKTGLGLVLAGEPWTATESTHRRNVWRIAAVDHSGPEPERRETYLWDLAGQPGYRLLHQLHLSDAAIAVVVFDARDEVDPFAGVRHWVRALRLAERERGTKVPRLLVSARVDRGGPAASDARIEEVINDLGFDGHIKTSAKEGWGIAELFEALTSRIDWATMPKVSSTGLFDSIKAFLVAERDRGRLVMPVNELVADYIATQDPSDTASDDLRDEFETCVGRVAARGLIRRLSFGGLVLLRPEVLDAYAASLVNAVRNQPDGTGEVSEDDARAGRFDMPADERVDDAQLERLLLAATVEEVLSHEIALREHSDEGSYLVFPTQSRRDAAEIPSPVQYFATVAFEGPVSHVYATLIVRVAHSGFFTRHETYRGATVFKKGEGLLGVSVIEHDEAAGVLRLFGNEKASTAAKRLLLDYVTTHAERRALAESIQVDLDVHCGGCDLQITKDQRDLAIARGRTIVRCMVCETEIPIAGLELEESTNDLVIRKMDASADAERDLSAARASLVGKQELGEFDVFLAHNSADKATVHRLAENLRGFGINPWVDDEQIPPGRWFQDVIQRAIGVIPVVAIIIGPSGLGPWEAVELRAFIGECVERDTPVVPVALPDPSTENASRIPRELRFLRGLGWVSFAKTVDDADALDRLRWGIVDPTDARGRPKGRHPRHLPET